MIEEKSWKEFSETGLLWFINQTLHLFGWALVFDGDRCYPAKTKFRGFDESINTKGYEKLSQYMMDNAEQLVRESTDNYA